MDVATGEPHYYRIGTPELANNPLGLKECYEQIRDLFALLGAREDLNLYTIIEKQASSPS